MKVAGLLLAGGRSSRYGKQKLFETYKNEPLFMKSVRAMCEAGIDDVYVVTNKELVSDFHTLPTICEQTPFEGPLYALFEGMTRLKESGFSHFQVLAGDLPEIDASMVKYLMKTATAHDDSDIFLPEHLGRLQPLHGLYHRRCLP
ncbi:molybdenum cofactor guanylyltransferase [Bacillus sp. JCM 19041]|uniref:molybdenum cofactor guanylyltransferase n=1 Tax=Bacillus sp. JCM 19041 TaxID=1460637 RepID=UPI0006D233D2